MPVKLTMTSDTASLLRDISKLEAQQARLKGKLAETGRAGKKAGDDTRSSMKRANQEGFGPKALAGVARYAAGFLGVGAAVGAVTSALREMSRAEAEAGKQSAAAAPGLGQLGQLALGDRKKLRDLIGASKDLFRGGGASSLDQASRIIFALESAGVPAGDRGLFTDLFGIVGQPEVLARAATTMLKSVGQEETGDLRAIISKGFAASQFAPSTVESLMEAASRGGVPARALGVRDEALLAATTILAEASGSAEQGGTQISSFLRSMQKAGGFKGLGLPGGIARIQGMGLSDPELIKFLGRQEAATAFGVLSAQGPELAHRIREIDQAQRGDLLGQMISAHQAAPELGIPRRAQMGLGELEVARGPTGLAKQIVDRAFDAARAEAATQGRFDQFISEFNILRGRMGRFAIGSEQMVEGSGARVDDLSSVQRFITDQDRAQLAAAQALSEAADKLSAAAEAQRGGPALSRPEIDR